MRITIEGHKQILLTGGCPLVINQTTLLGGLASTSHFNETSIPSCIGIPKPGTLVMAKDGESGYTVEKL